MSERLDSLDGYYTLCAHCDHFVEQTYDEDEVVHVQLVIPGSVFSPIDVDHAAAFSELTFTLGEWRVRRPDLFVRHADGKIGALSAHHTVGTRG